MDSQKTIHTLTVSLYTYERFLPRLKKSLFKVQDYFLDMAGPLACLGQISSIRGPRSVQRTPKQSNSFRRSLGIALKHITHLASLPEAIPIPWYCFEAYIASMPEAGHLKFCVRLLTADPQVLQSVMGYRLELIAIPRQDRSPLFLVFNFKIPQLSLLLQSLEVEDGSILQPSSRKRLEGTSASSLPGVTVKLMILHNKELSGTPLPGGVQCPINYTIIQNSCYTSEMTGNEW